MKGSSWNNNFCFGKKKVKSNSEKKLQDKPIEKEKVKKNDIKRHVI